MSVIKSFKVRMHMNYAEYETKLKENPELMNDILGDFVTNMSNGPIDEVIKFFNLEDEDTEGLADSNFAIGYKIVGEDANAKVLAVNIRLDIKLDDPNEAMIPDEPVETSAPEIPNIPGMPNIAEMLASGLAASQDDTVDTVVDSEGEVVMESDTTEVTEEAPVEETTEDVPAEDGESDWVDADPNEVPFKDETPAEEPTTETPVEEVSEEALVEKTVEEPKEEVVENTPTVETLVEETTEA